MHVQFILHHAKKYLKSVCGDFAQVDLKNRWTENLKQGSLQ